jgi:FixJ family two-component response regulator
MANTVMLVDDDTPFRTALIKLLRKSGVMVWAFQDAEAAIRAANTCCPDVALLDVCLPGMKGGQLRELLRVKCPNARVIFVTGDRTQLHKQTGEMIIDKPVSPERLLDIIHGDDLRSASKRLAI